MTSVAGTDSSRSSAVRRPSFPDAPETRIAVGATALAALDQLELLGRLLDVLQRDVGRAVVDGRVVDLLLVHPLRELGDVAEAHGVAGELGEGPGDLVRDALHRQQL